MSIASKLIRLNEVKHEIASAITEKGVTVKNSDPFSEYPNLISKIDTEKDSEDEDEETVETPIDNTTSASSKDPDTTATDLNVVQKPDTITENGVYKATDEDPSILVDEEETTLTEGDETGTETTTTTPKKKKKKSNRVDGYSSVEVNVAGGNTGGEYTVNWYSPDGSTSVQKLVGSSSSPSIADTEKELKNIENGGNVDLLNRPVINTSALISAGFTNAGQGQATVYSSTYSNEAGTEYRNFTPIRSDGSVMNKTEFDKYCEEVCDGIHGDTEKLQIGSPYSSLQSAETDANRVHELHESYYLNGGNETTGIENITDISWDKIYNYGKTVVEETISGGSGNNEQQNQNTTTITAPTSNTSLDSVSGIKSGGHASFLGTTPPMAEDGNPLKPFILWTPKTDYVTGNMNVIGLFDDKEVDLEGAEQWAATWKTTDSERFSWLKSLEIHDSWDEIVKKSGTYEIGAWKPLFLDFRETGEEKKTAGVNLGPAIGGMYPRLSFSRVLIMRKVYEGEQGTASTWISDTITRLPVDWDLIHDENVTHVDIAISDGNISLPVDVYLKNSKEYSERDGYLSFFPEVLRKAIAPVSKSYTSGFHDVESNGSTNVKLTDVILPDRPIWIPSAKELGDVSTNLSETEDINYDETFYVDTGSTRRPHLYQIGSRNLDIYYTSTLSSDRGGAGSQLNATYLTRSIDFSSYGENGYPILKTCNPMSGFGSISNIGVNSDTTRFLYRIGFCL